MLRSNHSLALAILFASATFLINCGNPNSPSSGRGANSAPAYGEGTGASGQTAPAKFVYANPAIGGPYALSIEASGMLTVETGGSADGINPMTIAIDPSGSFVFQAVGGYDGGTLGGLFAYVINRSNGSLTTTAGSPYMTSVSLFSDAVDNTGKYLYVQGTSGVYAFSIQPGTGALTPLSGSPFPVAGPPSSPGFTEPANLMTIDQTNRFLYVSTSAGISAYTIDASTGALTAISGAPFGPTVTQPWTIVVTPNDQFLYELQSTNTGVMYGYSIDSSSGALTAISGSPFNVGNCGSTMTGIPGPDNMTIASAGKFLYDNCGTYSLDQNTGAVAQVSTSGAGDWPVIDPTGDFLWAITAQQNCFQCDVGVTAYQVDSTTGALTAVPNSFQALTNSEVGDVFSLAITQ